MEDEEDVQILGGHEKETITMQSIISIEEAWIEGDVTIGTIEEEVIPER